MPMSNDAEENETVKNTLRGTVEVLRMTRLIAEQQGMLDPAAMSGFDRAAWVVEKLIDEPTPSLGRPIADPTRDLLALDESRRVVLDRANLERLTAQFRANDQLPNWSEEVQLGYMMALALFEGTARTMPDL